ncbi:hypothetical protein [Legionella cardiaca]|uniref:hypothetical protein n=1 Tax=Legionella cardiaca TaxID=1071983 RepID=UPI003B84B297
MGNHSYSHPYFSKTSLDVIYQEIQKTEELIGNAIKRHIKSGSNSFAFWGSWGAEENAKEASNKEEYQIVQAIQEMITHLVLSLFILMMNPLGLSMLLGLGHSGLSPNI